MAHYNLPMANPLIALVKDGRLVLDVPTDLPEGTQVELSVDDVEDDDEELLAELDESLEQSERDEVVSADVVMAELRARSTS